MAETDQLPTVRFPHPHEIVWDKITLIKAPVYLDNVLVAAIVGSTITIYDDSGNVVIATTAVTITGDIATYSVPADTFAVSDVPRRIRVVWFFTFATGTKTAENDGYVCARVLYPAISLGDIFRRLPALDPSGTAPATAHTVAQLQEFMDSAYTDIIDRMCNEGMRASWILSPSSLRDHHLKLTVSYIYGDEATRLNPAFQPLTEKWERKAERAWGAMTVVQDRSGDGIPEHPARRIGVGAHSVWLGN